MATDSPAPEDEPEAEDETKPAEPETASEAEEAAPTGTATRSRRRDPKFRAELIGRLPMMAFEKWSAKENFKLDEEWAGVVSLQSDAILGPLEPFVKNRRN